MERKLAALAAAGWAVLLATTTPIGQAIAPGPAGLDDLVRQAETCDAAQLPDRPDAEVQSRLDDLHEVFADLPGFVDVYYAPFTAPAYRAVFVEAVPEAAYERLAGRPVGLHVVDGPLQADQSNPLDPPSQEDTECRGIRPGTWASGCTASFVFNDTQGNVYIGSAGHCFDTGERVRLGAHGPSGTVVFKADGTGILEDVDFALIEVDEDKEQFVSPEMCFWGGPTGGNQDAMIAGEPVVANGHGRTIGFPGDSALPPRPRAGVGLLWGSESFLWSGSMLGGDSGAPVAEKNGDALGTHVRSVPGPDATAFGTRWDVGMEAAEDALGIDLTLATAERHLDPAL